MNLKDWVCPACNKPSEIEEVMSNVTVASILVNIEADGFADYDEQTNEGGSIERFQCSECGASIKNKYDHDIVSVEELYTYLNSQK